MDTIKIHQPDRQSAEVQHLKEMLNEQNKKLEKLNQYKNKQKETWRRNAKIYYNRHYTKGGVLDDATVEANIEARRAYYKNYHQGKTVIKPPPTPEEIKKKEELRIAHKKMKRKEYNDRAYARRKQQE